MNQVFTKDCLAVIRVKSKPKPNQENKQRNHEEKTTKTKPQKKPKSKKLPNLFIYKNGGFCQTARVPMTQGMMFPDLRIRCMILLTENKCLQDFCVLDLQKTSLRYQWKRCSHWLKQRYILTLLTGSIEWSVFFNTRFISLISTTTGTWRLRIYRSCSMERQDEMMWCVFIQKLNSKSKPTNQRNPPKPTSQWRVVFLLLGFLIFNCRCCMLDWGLNLSVGAIPKK